MTRPDIDLGGGGKDLGDDGQVAKPEGSGGDNTKCKGICDNSCKGAMNNCEDDCESDYEGVCEQASEVLAACNHNCAFLPIPPVPGPNPRDECFKACLTAFENQCVEADLIDCQEGCQDDYTMCIIDCYADC
jgi:hypothetical protein